MTNSEALNACFDSNISPEILDELDRVWELCDVKFKWELERYKQWVIDLLSNNSNYADHPIVRAALNNENKRIMDVFWWDKERRLKRWVITKVTSDMSSSANDDTYGYKLEA